MKPLLYDADGEIVSILDAETRRIYRRDDGVIVEPWSPLVLPPSLHLPPQLQPVPKNVPVGFVDALEHDKERAKRAIFEALAPTPDPTEDFERDIQSMIRGLHARVVL